MPKPPPKGMDACAAASSGESKQEGAPPEVPKLLLAQPKQKGMKIGGTTVMDPQIMPEVCEEPEGTEPRDMIGELLANGRMWDRKVEDLAASHEAGGMSPDDAKETARARIADERGLLRIEHAKIRAREKEAEGIQKSVNHELEK